MCGRYAIKVSSAELQRWYNLQRDFPYDPKYNVAPTNRMPVIREDLDCTRTAARLRWGLVPFWAPDLSIGSRMINARAETIDTSKAFRQALKKRRCVVPASGFYEWEKLDSKTKQPWYIYPAESELWSFAGLWESWTDKTTNETVETYTIVTTEANEFMTQMHDRMPVILSANAMLDWLDPKVEDFEILKALLVPCPDAWMARYKVSPMVGNVKNESPDCIKPLAT